MDVADDNDVVGPGTDLAFSFGGLFLLTTIIVTVQLWFAIISADRTAQAAVEARRMLTAERQVSELLRKDVATLKKNHNELARPESASPHESDFTESIDVIRSELAQRTKEKEAQQVELNRIRDIIANGKTELSTKMRAVEETNRSLEEYKVRLIGKDQELASARKEATELASQLSVAKAAGGRLDELAVEMRTQLQKLKVENSRLTSALGASNDKPPLLKINDEKGVSIFAEGSAEPSLVLLDWLVNVVPTLVENGTKYKANVVEVVGYTDEVPVGRSMQGRKNLDESLLAVLNGKANSRTLGACDNVGLGMARAAAVVAELSRLGLGKQFRLLPLSAGPTVDLDDSIAKGQQIVVGLPERRRIEIRLRRAY